MPTNIAALVYALIGMGGALIWFRRSFTMAFRALAIWATAAVALFVVRDFLTVLLLTFVLLLAVAPLTGAARAALFVMVAPCLPVYVVAPLPFPGINFLVDLTHYKLAVIALLVPGLLNNTGARQPFAVSEAALIAYAMLTASIVGAALNATSGLRFFVDQVLVLVLPFVVIRRSIRTAEDLDLFMRAFVMAAVVLASVALVASIKRWDFYRLYEPHSLLSLSEFRDGLLRIAATANYHSLGYHLAAAILMIEYLKWRPAFGFRMPGVLSAMLLAGLYVTQSRGAMAGLGLGLIVMFLIRVRDRRAQVVLCLLAAGGAATGIHYLLTADFTQNDPYGTFAYRQDLLVTALLYIQDNPLGNYNYLDSIEFEHLRQGQNIIDITNLYLQIPLSYGIPALLLLIGAVAMPLVGLARQESLTGPDAMPPDSQPAGHDSTQPADGSASGGDRSLDAGDALPSDGPKAGKSSSQPADSPARARSNELWSSTHVGLHHGIPTVAFVIGAVLSLALLVFEPLYDAVFRRLSGRGLSIAAPKNVSGPMAQLMKDARQRLFARAALAGAIVGWLCLVATTSDVGLTMHLGMTLAALGHAAARRDLPLSSATPVRNGGQQPSSWLAAAR